MTQRIVPMIAYEDAAAAIDWLTQLERDGQIVMLATPDATYQGPKRHRETCEAARRWQDNPWVIDGLFVAVDDVDAHQAQAMSAGATVIRPLEDSAEAGMRLYTAEDPEGHRWMFGKQVGSTES